MSIYLDFNATTPVDPTVLDAMLPYFSEMFGNANSIHSAGQRSRAAVDRARESVAKLVGAKPGEIVFTSGGTESDNLAIWGSVTSSNRARRHVITTAIEHHAVLNACQALEKHDIDVTFVPVGRDGVVDPDDIRRALRPETVLVSVMHANNELGTIQPIAEIGEIAADADVYFHCDAVQSVGKIPVDVNGLGVDFLSISAHKIYGPKGMGALYVRAGTPVEPQLYGGHHERDRRPGTENVAGIAGFGQAAELASAHLADDAVRMGALRDNMEEALLGSISDIGVNGDRTKRVSNTTNVTFAAANGEALVIALDLMGIECSTGAACSSGAIEPSHVLTAIGLSMDEARSSVRFSLGRRTTAEEIDAAVNIIPEVVQRLRVLSPHSPARALA